MSTRIWYDKFISSAVSSPQNRQTPISTSLEAFSHPVIIRTQISIHMMTMVMLTHAWPFTDLCWHHTQISIDILTVVRLTRLSSHTNLRLTLTFTSPWPSPHPDLHLTLTFTSHWPVLARRLQYDCVHDLRGINSATSLCTCCLYNWYINTTMMGSSASTLSDRSALGMRLYWNTEYFEWQVGLGDDDCTETQNTLSDRSALGMRLYWNTEHFEWQVGLGDEIVLKHGILWVTGRPWGWDCTETQNTLSDRSALGWDCTETQNTLSDRSALGMRLYWNTEYFEWQVGLGDEVVLKHRTGWVTGQCDRSKKIVLFITQSGRKSSFVLYVDNNTRSWLTAVTWYIQTRPGSPHSSSLS